MGVGGRFARLGPSLRSVVRAIIDSVSGFFQRFMPRNLEDIPSPESRIGCIALPIEPCSPNSRPGVEPEGLSLALPMAAPEDTFAAVGASLASAPRTPWSECALHTGRFLTSAAWFLWNWPQLHHAPVCHCKLAGRFPRSIPGRYRRSSRVSLRLSPGRPVDDLQAGRFPLHFTAAPPKSIPVS